MKCSGWIALSLGGTCIIEAAFPKVGDVTVRYELRTHLRIL